MSSDMGGKEQFKQQLKYLIREQVSICVKIYRRFSTTLRSKSSKSPLEHFCCVHGPLGTVRRPNATSVQTINSLSGSTRKAWWHSFSPRCPQATRCANIRLRRFLSKTTNILGISSKLIQTKEFFGRVGLGLKPLSPPRGSYHLSYWTLNCKRSYHMFKGGSFPFPIVCNPEKNGWRAK